MVGAPQERPPKLTGVSVAQPQWELLEATTSQALKATNNVCALFQRLLSHACAGNPLEGDSGPVRLRGQSVNYEDQYLGGIISALSSELPVVTASGGPSGFASGVVARQPTGRNRFSRRLRPLFPLTSVNSGVYVSFMVVGNRTGSRRR